MSYECCCLCDHDDGLELAELDVGPGVLMHLSCFEADKSWYRHQIRCCYCRLLGDLADDELIRHDDRSGSRHKIRFAHKGCVAEHNERIRMEAVTIHQRLEALKAAGVDINTVQNIWDDPTGETGQ